jgi:hypothetical protein
MSESLSPEPLPGEPPDLCPGSSAPDPERPLGFSASSLSPRVALALAALTLAGGLLRFWNLNWDSGLLYHPDEMNLVMASARVSFFDAMDPKFYAYNGFAVYLYKGLGLLATAVSGNPAWGSDLGRLCRVARFVSALLSTLSIPLLFDLGHRLVSVRAGLLAALAGAFCAGLIQNAHYGTTETLLVFQQLLLLACTARAAERPSLPSPRTTLLWGALFGWSLGTKTSALLYLLIPGFFSLDRLLDEPPGWRERIRSALARALPFAAAALGLFLLVSPYSLIEWRAFLETMRYEGGIVKGTVSVPYTLQFVGTRPYLFFWENLPWHLGPLLPWTGLAGAVLWGAAILRGRASSAASGLLAFGAVYFLLVGSWHGKFIRYMMPLYPLLILASARLLDRIGEVAEERLGHAGRLVGAAAIGTALIPGLLWGLAVFSIFATPQTRTVASEWILEKVPQGSRLLTEHWDYRLPVPPPGRPGRYYAFSTVPNFDPDSPEKTRLLARTLAQGDWLILASQRLWGNIPRFPDRYPVAARYYGLLFSGDLGYREVVRFDSPPRLGPFRFPDGRAEETFSVFDHPPVRIFRNEKRLSPERLESLLAGATRAPARPEGTRGTPGGAQGNAGSPDGGTAGP